MEKYPNIVGDMIKRSGHKYNDQGEMYFEDSVYLTEWKFTEEYFHTEINYLYRRKEMITMPWTITDDPNINWHEFGFIQKFHDPKAKEVLSPYHRNNHLELYYVVKGSQEIRIEDEMVCLNEKDLVILNQQCHHSDVLSPNNMDIRIIGINLDYLETVLYPFISNQEIKGFITRMLDTMHVDSEYWIVRNIDLINLFEELSNEMRVKDDFYEDAIRLYLLRILQKLIPTEKKIKPFHGRKGIIFHEVDQYMRHNYERVSLDDLSSYLKFSKDYFNRLIKEITGMTYTEYLQLIRMEKACELLEKTDLTIRDIAYDVGYVNLAHFYEIFKEMYDLTPHEYRLTIRN